MSTKIITILGINPGTKYLAITVFRNSELREWSIKIFKGKWSKTKMKKILAVIADIITQYDANVLAIKRLHPSRSSQCLNLLVSEIKDTVRRRGLSICEYSIKQLERFYSSGTKGNKERMAERVVLEYPVLFHEFDKEKNHKNPYYIRLFEAVALGSACHDQLDST